MPIDYVKPRIDDSLQKKLVTMHRENKLPDYKSFGILNRLLNQTIHIGTQAYIKIRIDAR